MLFEFFDAPPCTVRFFLNSIAVAVADLGDATRTLHTELDMDWIHPWIELDWVECLRYRSRVNPKKTS